MRNPGADNHAGISAQDWAALSLFFQYLADCNFEYIHLEAPGFQDFNLVFSDGHKIICESKARINSFSFSSLKALLRSLIQKESISSNDEILVICTNLGVKLKDAFALVESRDLFGSVFINQFIENGFTEAEIALLPQIKFWEVNPEFNEKLACELFIDWIRPAFWLPERRLNSIVKTIFVEGIFKKSVRGDKFYRQALIDKIDEEVNGIIEDEGYDSQREKIYQILKRQKIILDQQGNLSNNRIAYISTQPEIHRFILEELAKKTIDNLSKYDSLWHASRKPGFSRGLIGIFTKNLGLNQNSQYIIKFIKNNITTLQGFYRSDFFKIEAIELTKRIIELDSSLLNEAFEIIKAVFIDKKNELFYIRNNSNLDYEKRKAAEVLKIIFRSSNLELKSKIYSFITANFNLVEDSSGHEQYTPNDLFSILRDYLASLLVELENRLGDLTNILSHQFNNFYQRLSKKLIFQGWEEMGSTAFSVGNSYHVFDRNFVDIILKFTLCNYYHADPLKAWEYIKANCITPTRKVSKRRPDFLNRAALPIVIQRYKDPDPKVSNEAFKILKEFILSPKGIPHKSELIYQELQRGDFTDQQIWNLLKISLDKYKIPASPLVEQITSKLAEKGFLDAKKQLLAWTVNPDYYKRFRPFINIVGNIRSLLKSDFKFALKIFNEFISSKNFIEDFDSFDAYDVATLVQEITDLNFESGSGILQSLAEKEVLEKNEQILLCYGFYKYRENDERDNINYLLKIYEYFVDPFLNSFQNNIDKISKRLSFAEVRESFVKFARRLAVHKKVEEALRIIKIFIRDPSPYLPTHDPLGSESEYNQHKQIENGEKPRTITSVRGWCAWALTSCANPESRSYIPQVIELTAKLLQDENWYVRHMACFPLSQLARNRLSIMPDNPNTLFFNDDADVALKMAKEVERLAFQLLREVAQASVNVQNAMAESVLAPFSHIKALNEQEAKELIEITFSCEKNLQIKASSLLIFFAELRRNSYKKWPWIVKGYYDDLTSFDDKYFKATLENLILEGPEEIRAHLAWEFWVLPINGREEDFERNFEISLRYLKIASKNYDHSVYEHIYHFINENIKDQFEACFELWKECLKKEKTFFEVNEKNISQMYWWPNYENDNILLLIKDKRSIKDFLDWLEFLSNYPLGLNIVHHVYKIAEQLLNVSKDYYHQVKNIFDNLIKRETSIYHLKEQWESKSKV